MIITPCFHILSGKRKFIMGGKGVPLLSLEERKTIEECLNRGYPNHRIAETLSRSVSCIKQEIRRNGGRDKYKADDANWRWEKINEHRKKYLQKKLTDEQMHFLKIAIDDGLSLNQIALQLNTSNVTLSRIIRENDLAIEKKNYTSFITRIEALETQIELIFELLKEKK